MKKSKPKVLIFDDEAQWAKTIEDTIKSEYFVKRTTKTKLWNEYMSSMFWDVIIVDVQIMGSVQNGAHLAEKAILEYGITSPIIIISGNVNLDVINAKYGKVFFDYISKDEYATKLPKAVERACDAINNGTHLNSMLPKLAKKYRVGDDEIIPEFIRKYKNTSPVLGIKKGMTVNELINSDHMATKKTDYGRRGRAILEIIENQR